MWDHLVNIATTGVPTPEQQARIDQDEVLDSMWHGDMIQIPVNMRDNPIGFADGISLAVPGVRTMRFPFNRNSFLPDGNFHPQMEAILARLTTHGWRILWNLADGPSQAAGEYSYAEQWPESYPPINSAQDAIALMPLLAARQQEAYARLLVWLDRNPAVRTQGFETMNEPATYARFGDRYPEHLETFLTAYADHVLALWDMVRVPHPETWLYVGGWRYSASVPELDGMVLGKYGRTAKGQFEHRIGDKLVWSLHYYSSWAPIQKSARSFYAHMTRTFGWMGPETRAVVTETNSPWTTANDWRLSDHHPRNAFLINRAGRFFAERRIGIGWWPGFNWAQSSMARITGTGAVDMVHPSSYEAFVRMCAVGNWPDMFPGAESGDRTAEIVPIADWTNEDTRWAAQPAAKPANTTQMGRAFGGRGVCVLRAQPTMNNFLIGGDGKTVIYGGNHDDRLMTGRGGGVIRTGPGANNVVTEGGQNRLYCGPGYNLVTMYYGTSDVILDPAGHHMIFGFDPYKGDRVSFRRAFTSVVGLHNAAAVEAAPSAMPEGSEYNFALTLPGGGRAVFHNGAGLSGKLHLFNRDLTDGWYEAGWQEPADFDPTEFDLPIVAPSDPQVTAGIMRDRTGQQVRIFARDGSPAAVRLLAS